ncbi:hypothetical protein, partial [Pseudomonas syringae group genomosp. 7]|uniref:hypothetical protein n=1 Tax=Pseudomonas syringae group genomosp. 7 TaxID=251699 RepID=UPI003770419B
MLLWVWLCFLLWLLLVWCCVWVLERFLFFFVVCWVGCCGVVECGLDPGSRLSLRLLPRLCSVLAGGIRS